MVIALSRRRFRSHNGEPPPHCSRAGLAGVPTRPAQAVAGITYRGVSTPPRRFSLIFVPHRHTGDMYRDARSLRSPGVAAQACCGVEAHRSNRRPLYPAHDEAPQPKPHTHAPRFAPCNNAHDAVAPACARRAACRGISPHSFRRGQRACCATSPEVVPPSCAPEARASSNPRGLMRSGPRDVLDQRPSSLSAPLAPSDPLRSPRLAVIRRRAVRLLHRNTSSHRTQMRMQMRAAPPA